MRVPIDEVVYFDVVTHAPTTGAISDADSTPTFAVYEEATDTDIGVGGNLTKRTSLTGDYRGSFTASAANGFEAGKWYVVIASATVGAVAGKTVAMHFMCVPAETLAGVAKVDVSALLGTAWLTPGTAGTPDVNAKLLGGTAQTGGDLFGTRAEPAQGAPGATISLAAKIDFLYKAWRNRTTQTASQYSLYGDDATTVHHKATFSDNATTADRGEVATGP